ncbi:fimbrillin family protein [Bacteroides xylanisolvens]|uniref:fimbrillin family protein n=1 Tax=Bacteroides xylanisolvens TaxID=371601 RepID=UPI0022EAFA13|nr:fimbrillin family protein [Bacteroides xylanisolvens]
MNTKYIMKKQGFWLLCLLGVIGLSSCTNESEEQTVSSNLLMELKAQVNQEKTRASSENSWIGDGTEQISLNVGEKKVTFKVTDVDGTLEPINEENQLFWPVPLKPQTVTAWYPATEGNNQLASWSVQADQSGTGFQQSDLLYTMAEITFQGSKILPFEHLPAKVIVNLKGNGKNEAELTNAVVTIENSVLSGSVSEGVLSVSQGEGKAITPKKVSSPDGYVYTCHALLIPQDVSGKKFIKIQMSGRTFYYTPEEGDANLIGGFKSVYNITVGDQKIVVSVEKNSAQWGSEGEETVDLEPIS